MSKDKRFIVLFSFAAYFFISFTLGSFVRPFGDLLSAWAGMLFDPSFVFDVSIIWGSLLNSAIIISVISLVLFSIRRFGNKSSGFQDLLKIILNVLVVAIVFLIINIIFIYLQSVLVDLVINFAIINWVVQAIGIIIDVLYFSCMAVIADKGRVRFSDFAVLFRESRYRKGCLLAIVAKILTGAIPQIFYMATEKYMPQWWYSYGQSALIAFVFTVLIASIFEENSAIVE